MFRLRFWGNVVRGCARLQSDGELPLSSVQDQYQFIFMAVAFMLERVLQPTPPPRPSHLAEVKSHPLQSVLKRGRKRKCLVLTSCMQIPPLQLKSRRKQIVHIRQEETEVELMDGSR